MARNSRALPNNLEQDSEYLTIATPDVELRVSLGRDQQRGSPARMSLPLQPVQGRTSMPPRISQPLPARTSQFNAPRASQFNAPRPSQLSPPRLSQPALPRPSQFSRPSQAAEMPEKMRQLFGDSLLPEPEIRPTRTSAALDVQSSRASVAALGHRLADEQTYASELEEENRNLKVQYEDYLRRLQEENGQLRLAESQLMQATQERQQLEEHMEPLIESTHRRSSSEVAMTAQHFREKMGRLKQEIKALEARVQHQQIRTQYLNEQLRENKSAAAAQVQTLNGALNSLKERYAEVREENAALRANAVRVEGDPNMAVLLDAKECTIEALQNRLRMLEAENAQKAADCKRCFTKDQVIDDMSALLARDEPAPVVNVEKTTVYADTPQYLAYQSPLVVERTALPAYAELTPQVRPLQRPSLGGGYSSRTVASSSRERFLENKYAPTHSTYVTERVYEGTPRTYIAEHPRHAYFTEHVYEPEVVLKPAALRSVFAPSRAFVPACEAAHLYCAPAHTPTTVSMTHRETDRFGNVITDESLVFID